MATQDAVKRRYLREENARYTEHFALIPVERWPETDMLTAVPTHVWRSNRYLVQVFEPVQGATRLSITIADLDGQGRFRDGLSWDEIQRIKSSVGFGDKDAVEIYPNDKDVVNVANMRHIWVLDEPLIFAWRRQ